MLDNMYTEDFKAEPYWWDRTPRPQVAGEVPASADVVVVGSGYSGLHAAIQTARGGRSTVVLDAEDAGWGCSSRNGGQVSTSIRLSYRTLAQRHGAKLATDLMVEGEQALKWIGDFIDQEAIDCDFRKVGRFYAARNRAGYERIMREREETPSDLRPEAYPVSQAEQRQELGTDLYRGGLIFPNHASLDPGRYHLGVLQVAQQSGASVVTRCRVTGIERRGEGDYLVHTNRGAVSARDVVVATNGYSDSAAPWMHRRVIPIGSYMIATEPLPAELMDRLMPKRRIVSDTRRLVYYYRPSPDGQRILFGGRVSATETDVRKSAMRLRTALVQIFPELAEVKVARSWMGFVAYTFDNMAHVGEWDGIHYATGYCGSGVSMASYLGMRVGLRVLGKPEGNTAFAATSFQKRFYYHGYPWFLGPAVIFFRWRDQLGLH